MKLRKIVKNISCIALVLILFSCKESTDGLLITKVTDLTGDEEVISDIEYDGDGRIVKYGETPIKYEGDRVTVGEMDCLDTGSRLCTVTFKMVKGKAKESKARCMLKLGLNAYEANKATVYEYGADTLRVQSEYYAVSDNRFLRYVCGKYVFGEEGKLVEVITAYREANDSTSVCHTYYNYDNHINYEANLNLQAYIVDRDGLDSFFYFLLNMGGLRDKTSLPNDIGYCLNHGTDTYNVHANYRLDNESPVRIEVLYNYTKLLSRIDLVYTRSE
ncbi:hypothetical protein [Phocaeicola sp.]